jgi:hypothetical protein
MKAVRIIHLAVLGILLASCAPAKVAETVAPASTVAELSTSTPAATFTPIPSTSTPVPPSPTATIVPPTETPTSDQVVVKIGEDSWRMAPPQMNRRVDNIGPDRLSYVAGEGRAFVMLTLEGQTGNSLFDVYLKSGADLSNIYLEGTDGKIYLALQLTDLPEAAQKTTTVTFETVPVEQVNSLELHVLSAEPVMLAGGEVGAVGVAEPTPAGELYWLYPFCNCEDTVPAGDVPVLHWGWITVTEAQGKDFISASTTVVTIDGTAYQVQQQNWGPVAYSSKDNGYKTGWNYTLPALGPGTHRVEFSLSLSSTVTDGYDTNNDGAVDQYGPGDAFYGWVDVVIQP